MEISSHGNKCGNSGSPQYKCILSIEKGEHVILTNSQQLSIFTNFVYYIITSRVKQKFHLFLQEQYA